MKLLLATLAAVFVAAQSADARLRLGLAWGTDNRWMKTIAKGNIEWYHHWQDGPVPGAPSSVQFVPMYWGPSKTDLWNQRKAEMRKNLPTRLLFVNEPDVQGQANISPEYAAQLFIQEMVPWQKKGVKVSSPQIVWNFDWMDTFMKEVKAKGAKPDFMAIHWYGSYQDLSGLQNFVQKTYTRYGMSVWLTEYGVTTKSGASDAQLSAFLQKATSWLASKHYVKRAAWLGCFAINNPPDAFASNKNAFFNGDGSLRTMAKWYVSYSTRRSLSGSAAGVIQSPGQLRHLKGRAQKHHRDIASNLSQVGSGGEDEASATTTDASDEVAATEDIEIEHCDEICKLRAASVSATAEGDALLDDLVVDEDSLVD